MALIKFKCLHQWTTKTSLLSGHGDINEWNMYIPTHCALSSSGIIMSTHSNNNTTAYTNEHSNRSVIIANNQTQGHQISTIQLHINQFIQHYKREDVGPL